MGGDLERACLHASAQWAVQPTATTTSVTTTRLQPAGGGPRLARNYTFYSPSFPPPPLGDVESPHLEVSRSPTSERVSRRIRYLDCGCVCERTKRESDKVRGIHVRWPLTKVGAP